MDDAESRRRGIAIIGIVFPRDRATEAAELCGIGAGDTQGIVVVPLGQVESLEPLVGNFPNKLVAHIGLILGEGFGEVACLLVGGGPLISRHHLPKELALGFLIGMELLRGEEAAVLGQPVVADVLTRGALSDLAFGIREELGNGHARR